MALKPDEEHLGYLLAYLFLLHSGVFIWGRRPDVGRKPYKTENSSSLRQEFFHSQRSLLIRRPILPAPVQRLGRKTGKNNVKLVLCYN